jgi:hypothetical protein
MGNRLVVTIGNSKLIVENMKIMSLRGNGYNDFRLN